MRSTSGMVNKVTLQNRDAYSTNNDNDLFNLRRSKKRGKEAEVDAYSLLIALAG